MITARGVSQACQAACSPAGRSLFRNERNLYITGGSLFIFLVLYRIIDVQSKLHEHRERVKELEAQNKEMTTRLSMLVPSAVPIGEPVDGKRKVH